MKYKKIGSGVAALMLAGTAATGFWLWHAERNRTLQLEAQVAELQKQEKRSAIDRNVSKQMEDIAYQQKVISDEQREEAVEQRSIAESQRQMAEHERQNALEAEHLAKEKEQEAKTMQGVAEEQRLQAEHQRIKAELAKRQADTLSFIALGRSLGSFSSIQMQSGNTDLARLLAYASYIFTSRYKGDVFNLAVFQALMEASQSKRTWGVHNGAVTGIDFFPGTADKLVSVSNYGEIFCHEKKNDNLYTQKLFADHNYDFRSVNVDPKGMLSAVSRSGHLVIIEGGKTTIHTLENVEKPFATMGLDENTFVVLAEKMLAFYNRHNYTQLSVQHLSHKVTTYNRTNSNPFFVDDQGYMYEIVTPTNIKKNKLPKGVTGTITAYASSKNEKAEAFGNSEGKIFVVLANGQLKELMGHRSRVSRLKFNGKRLFSTSYDGTLNLWMYVSDKVEPMLITQTNGWTTYFTSNNVKDELWAGDQKGNLTEALVSVPRIVQKLKASLKREFTHDEWDYYIGKNIPYETFRDRKEAQP